MKTLTANQLIPQSTYSLTLTQPSGQSGPNRRHTGPNTSKASLAPCLHGNTKRASLALSSHGNASQAAAQAPRPKSGSRRRRRRRSWRGLFTLLICAAVTFAVILLPVFSGKDRGKTTPSSYLKQENSQAGQDSTANRGTLADQRNTSAGKGAPDSAGSGGPGENPASDNADGTGASADDETSWSLILVNKWNRIPEGYQDNIEITELSNGQSVDSRIYPALQAMFDQMRSDGVYPIVASGFRTTEKQQSLMDEKIASFLAQGYSDDEARAEAEKWVAVPGTSEHQLGLGVDINADGIHSAGYQVYDWLDRHAHEYGFIHRYPSDKTDITGISNEPWHYRYVGTEAAAEIHERGICLEEYLEKTGRED